MSIFLCVSRACLPWQTTITFHQNAAMHVFKRRFHVFTHRLLRPEHEVSLLPVFIPPSAFLVQRAFQCHASSCGLKVLHADAFRKLACPHKRRAVRDFSWFSRVSIATLSNSRDFRHRVQMDELLLCEWIPLRPSKRSERASRDVDVLNSI